MSNKDRGVRLPLHVEMFTKGKSVVWYRWTVHTDGTVAVLTMEDGPAKASEFRNKAAWLAHYAKKRDALQKAGYAHQRIDN